MDNTKIRVDRKKPTREEILGSKDFDRLYSAYESETGAATGSASRLRYWLIGAGGAALVVLAGFFLMQPSEPDFEATKPAIPEPEPAATYNVVAPFTAAKPRTETKVFSAEKGIVFESTNGTEIRIPAGSLLDENGQVVEGEVHLQLSEPQEVREAFMHGVPLHTASNELLDASGAFEIRIEADGKAVKLRQGALIEVAFLDAVENGSELLFLDEEKGWLSQGTYQVETEEAVEVRFTEAELQMQKPVEPRRVGEESTVFAIDVATYEFPELKNYQDMMFEVNEAKTPIDSSAVDYYWDTMRLERLGETGEYELEMIEYPDSSLKLVIYPVFDLQQYDRATDAYREDLKRYEAVQQYKKQMREKSGDGSTSLQLNYLGWWHVGEHHPMPKTAGKAIRFLNEANEQLDASRIFLLDREDNTMIRNEALVGQLYASQPERYTVYALAGDKLYGLQGSWEKALTDQTLQLRALDQFPAE